MRLNEQLNDQVFRHEYDRLHGSGLFFIRLWALLIKRWHVSRRQLSLLFGFFLLSILLEILAVAIVPTPQEIQSILLQNERVDDAQVTFNPSIYNPQTIVTYFNENATHVRPNLLEYLNANGAQVDEIFTANVSAYVRERYTRSARVFIDQYQLGFATFANRSAVEYDAYFSTVNYHAMPTSLSVATTNLFRFYANSTSRSIRTTNQPILTTTKASTYIAEILSVLYCFEVFPVSLFSLINSILATIFIGILLLTLIAERLNHSKDLQLLTNLSRGVYWLSNWLFDFALCLILCALLTIIIKVSDKRPQYVDLLQQNSRSVRKRIPRQMPKFTSTAVAKQRATTSCSSFSTRWRHCRSPTYSPSFPARPSSVSPTSSSSMSLPTSSTQ